MNTKRVLICAKQEFYLKIPVWSDFVQKADFISRYLVKRPEFLSVKMTKLCEDCRVPVICRILVVFIGHACIQCPDRISFAVVGVEASVPRPL